MNGTAGAGASCGMIVAMTQATPHVPHDGRMRYFCGPRREQGLTDDQGRYPA
jgi:hypothetical protein